MADKNRFRFSKTVGAAMGPQNPDSDRVNDKEYSEATEQVRNLRQACQNFMTEVESGQSTDKVKKQMVEQINHKLSAINYANMGPPSDEEQVQRRQQMYDDFEMPNPDVMGQMDLEAKEAVLNASIASLCMTRSAHMKKTLKVTLSEKSSSSLVYKTAYERGIVTKEVQDAQLKIHLTEHDLVSCSHQSIFENFHDTIPEVDGCGPYFLIQQETKIIDDSFILGPMFFMQYGNSTVWYILFLCRGCGLFGLYNATLKKRCTSTEIMSLMLMMIKNLRELLTTEKEPVYHLTGIILCLFAAHSASMPPNRMPTMPYQFVVHASHALLSMMDNNQFKDSVEYRWLYGIFEIMAAMVFMKRNETLESQWYSLQHYLATIKHWLLNDRFPSTSFIQKGVFHSFDCQEVKNNGRVEGAYLIFKTMGNENQDSCPRVYIADNSWFTNHTKKEEETFTKAVITLESIRNMVADPEFRQKTSIRQVVDLIITYFIMLFMLYQWTQGAFMAGISAHYEVFKNLISRRNIGRYTFEYPTYSQLGDYVKECFEILLSFNESGITGFSTLWSYISRLMTLKQRILTNYNFKHTDLTGPQLGIEEDDELAAFEADLDADIERGIESEGLDDADDFLDSVMQEHHNLRNAFDDIDNDFSTKIAEFDRKRKEKESNFRVIYDGLREINADYLNKLMDYEKRIKELEVEIGKLRENIVKDSSKLTVSVRRLEAINKKLLVIKKKKAELLMKQKEEERHRQMYLIEKDILNLQLMQLREIKTEKERISKEAADIRKKIEEVEDQESHLILQNELIKNSDLQKQIMEMETTLSDMEKQRKGHEKNLQDIATEIEKADQEFEKYNDEVKDQTKAVRDGLVKVQTTINKYKKQIDNLKKEQEILQHSIETQEESKAQMLQHLEDITGVLGEAKLRSLKALKDLVLSKGCGCGPYYTLSLEQLVRTAFTNKHYALRCFDTDPDTKLIRQFSLIVTVADERASSWDVRIVNGLYAQSPTWKNEVLVATVSHWMNKLATDSTMDNFERHGLSILMCNLIFFLKKNKVSFDVPEAPNAKYPWVYKIVAAVEEATCLRQLVSAWDYVHENSALPHIHCKLADCNEQAAELPPIKLNSHDPHRFVGIHYVGDRHAGIYHDGDGRIYFLFPDTKEVTAYDTLLDQFSKIIREPNWENTSASMDILLWIYWTLRDWLNEDDLRLVTMREDLKKLFLVATGCSETADLWFQWIDATRSTISSLFKPSSLVNYRRFLAQYIKAQTCVTLPMTQTEEPIPRTWSTGLTNYTSLVKCTKLNHNAYRLKNLPNEASWLMVNDHGRNRDVELLGEKLSSDGAHKIIEQLEFLILALHYHLLPSEILMLGEQLIIFFRAAVMLGAGTENLLLKLRDRIAECSQYMKSSLDTSSLVSLQLMHLTLSACHCCMDLSLEESFVLFHVFTGRYLDNHKGLRRTFNNVILTQPANCLDGRCAILNEDSLQEFERVFMVREGTTPFKFHYNACTRNVCALKDGKKVHKFDDDDLVEEIIAAITRLTMKMFEGSVFTFIPEVLAFVMLFSSLGLKESGIRSQLLQNLYREFKEHALYKLDGLLDIKARVLLIAMKFATEMAHISRQATSYQLYSWLELLLCMIPKFKEQARVLCVEEGKNVASVDVSNGPGLFYTEEKRVNKVYCRCGEYYVRVKFETGAIISSKTDVNVHRAKRTANSTIEWVQVRYEDQEEWLSSIFQLVNGGYAYEYTRLLAAIICHYSCKGDGILLKEHLEIIKQPDSQKTNRITDSMAWFTAALTNESNKKAKLLLESCITSIDDLIKDQQAGVSDLWKLYLDTLNKIYYKRDDIESSNIFVAISVEEIEDDEFDGGNEFDS